MTYLLDTHSFLWFIAGDDQLSKTAQQIILDTNTVKYISIASFWEIAIKISLGKLSLGMPYSDLEEHVIKNGFEILPLGFNHTMILANLDCYHRDPFDRILIAQALTENLTIITRDEHFKLYDKVQLSW